MNILLYHMNLPKLEGRGSTNDLLTCFFRVRPVQNDWKVAHYISKYIFSIESFDDLGLGKLTRLGFKAMYLPT